MIEANPDATGSRILASKRPHDSLGERARVTDVLGLFGRLSRKLQRRCPREVAGKGGARGWQVIDPHGEILPELQCVASFKSYAPTRIPEWDYSYLDVCWFVESLDVNLRDLVASVLPYVDWEHRALDASWNDL